MNLDFTLHNSLHELKRLQMYLSVLEQEWHICRKTVTEVNLVLEELFSNIVIHGDQEASYQVEFKLTKEAGKLHITVIDDGPAFDLTCSKAPDTGLALEKRKCGGLGILLIQKFCSGCNYLRENGKNIITLTKILPEDCCSQPSTAKRTNENNS